MSIKFTISSRKLGWEQTYPVIIPSLINCGVPANDIYFFIGGFDKTEISISNEGVNVIKVTQNSIDYTGLIGVLDLQIHADYWMLLHDTCYVGPNFYKNIVNYNYNNAPMVSLSYDLSMNIGSYSWDYLQNIKDELFQYRNTDFTENSIQYWKKIGVLNEDVFFKNFKHLHHYCNTQRLVSDPVNLYNSNTLRIIEYFPNIDLYKAKANWNAKPIYELNV